MLNTKTKIKKLKTKKEIFNVLLTFTILIKFSRALFIGTKNLLCLAVIFSISSSDNESDPRI